MRFLLLGKISITSGLHIARMHTTVKIHILQIKKDSNSQESVQQRIKSSAKRKKTQSADHAATHARKKYPPLYPPTV
jgi:hypothetical protein